jgi:hypothetical protein
MPRIFRLFRALLAESLVIGLLVVLFGLPCGDVPPDRMHRATHENSPAPQAVPEDRWWNVAREPVEDVVPSTAVHEELRHAASEARAALKRELDRVIAPFVAARSAKSP